MFQTILDQWTPRRITDYKSVRESSAFCMMPFIHLFVSHFGTVIPCCLTPWHEEQALGNVNEQSIEEIWNGAPMRAFRRKMLRDQQDERCSQCYTNEQVGLRSMRLIYNHLYEHKIDWALDTSRSGKVRSAKPIFWDIRFSNLCNFRCRICGHHSSSNWFEDAKAIGETAHETKVHRGVKDFEGVMKQLEAILPDLEEIFFAGGEPLIMEEHYQLLQLFIKHGKTDVQLRYNTNFSRLSYKGEAVFDLWKHFSNVQVNASLDGEQERGEYQRKGQSWEEVLENRKLLREKCPQVDFLITSTTSVFNILHLPDFHRNWVEAGWIDLDELIPHTLKHPQIYNIQILPTTLKEQAATKIIKHIEWIMDTFHTTTLPPEKYPNLDAWRAWATRNDIQQHTGRVKLDLIINEYQHALTYMFEDDLSHLTQKFRQRTEELDMLREENFITTFPELKALWEAALS